MLAGSGSTSIVERALDARLGTARLCLLVDDETRRAPLAARGFHLVLKASTHPVTLREALYGQAIHAWRRRSGAFVTRYRPSGDRMSAVGRIARAG